MEMSSVEIDTEEQLWLGAKDRHGQRDKIILISSCNRCAYWRRDHGKNLLPYLVINALINTLH